MEVPKRPSAPVSPLPSVSLPTSGGAIRAIGEKFNANPVTGTSSMTIPLALSPGRTGFSPSLSLSYDSGSGNGAFGMGWALSLPIISRKTNRGLPRYMDEIDSDTFTMAGVEDLVPELDENGAKYELTKLAPGYIIHRYRPRVDGGTSGRLERWANSSDRSDVHWRHYSADNVLTRYGVSKDDRVFDPLEQMKIFSWLISDMSDCKGNGIVYSYKSEDGSDVDLSKPHQGNRGDPTDARRTSNRYLKYVFYGNKTSLLNDAGERPLFLPKELVHSQDWMFQMVFDYGEHNNGIPTPRQDNVWKPRQDAFSVYRSGCEVRTARLCRRVLMFHHFDDEKDVGRDCLVRSTNFTYSNPSSHPAVYTFLTSVQQLGYRRNGDAYVQRNTPSVDFQYSEPKLIDKLEPVDESILENLPAGLATSGTQFIDLYSEGISGIMASENGGVAWFYKSNESPLNQVVDEGNLVTKPRFNATAVVLTKPNVHDGEHPRIVDIDGSGMLSILDEDEEMSGFYKSDGKDGWGDFKPFTSRPNLRLKDKDCKMLDLTGDGLADILAEGEGKWYESLGESGFNLPRDVSYAQDEESGPVNIFSDSTLGSVYTGDLSGDGLPDMIRIRNGEVCYWPNLGYGKFGAKLTMDNSPWFCDREAFDPKKIILADLDGSGTTDIIYLGADNVKCYFNESGNGWSNSQELEAFPPIANEITLVQAVDLLGNGTSCLFFSTPIAPPGHPRMSYIPLMGAQKPHLLTQITNNTGSNTTLTYAPSTKFYLKDKHAGSPWICKLPFPVHCVESVVVEDHISKNRFGATYAYHHGFYDGVEREFRGFGMVEEWDIEEIFSIRNHDPGSPNFEGVKTFAIHKKTWFHQGMWSNSNAISLQFENEYFRPPALNESAVRAWLLPDTIMPDGLTTDEERDACRALKGKMLRQEIYSAAPFGSQEVVAANDEVPFTVSESNFTLRLLQKRVPSMNSTIASAPAVVMANANETLNHTYERSLTSDPKITHSIVLQTNEFGQILQEVAISYGRISPDLGLPTDWDRQMQENSIVTYNITHMTNAVDDNTKWPFMYRIPSVAESSSWEITGFSRGNKSQPFKIDTFYKDETYVVDTIPSIPFEQEPNLSLAQKRRFECNRTLFRSDDLRSTLPLTHMEPLAIAANNYQLAFSESMINTYLSKNNTPLIPNPVTLLAGKTVNHGGYSRGSEMKALNLFLDSDADDDYWIPSGDSFFSMSDDPAIELQDARKSFFLPVRFKSPFGVESKVTFDKYHLLICDTEDFVGNHRTVGRRDASGTILSNGNDYRVLQPNHVTDMNLNRSEVLFDALGDVVATSVKGKEGERVGDDDLTGLDPDPDEILVLEHLRNPTDDPFSILQGATTRILYDSFAYFRTRNDPQPQPAVVYTLSRTTHQADLHGDEKTEVHHSFSYADGIGRAVQKKHQTNAGPVSKRDAEGHIMLDKEKQPVLTDTVSNPRWICSGWVVYNHKGLGITQFEPFFTHLHTFEFDVRAGISPINFYDALGRIPVTLRPDGTYGKNTFDSWSSAIWDPNDTVELDPRTDPDVQEYVAGYFAGNFVLSGFQTWLQTRQDARITEELEAAQQTLEHKNTPSRTHFDSLGRPFLTIAHRKTSAAEHFQDGLDVMQYTRVVMDTEGRTRALRDASVQDNDPLGRIVEKMDYDMIGRVVRNQCMERGFSWSLVNIFGQSMISWNERGLTVRSKYDDASRLISASVLGDVLAPEGPDKEIQISRVIYGETHHEAVERNLRGRTWLDLDQSGSATVERLDFKGNVVESTQRFCSEYKKSVDWAVVESAIPANFRSPVDIPTLEATLSTKLESEFFTDQSSFDAMDRTITATLPQSNTGQTQPSTVRMGYDVLSLVKIESNIQQEQENGEKKWTSFVDGIQYTADGRRTAIQYHNGVETKYFYEINHKIKRQLTSRVQNGRSENLQDLQYTYDAVGNITNLLDSAKQTLYFRNVIVEPTQQFIYDSLYQLIQATGREHLGQPGGIPIPYSHSDSGRSGPQPGDESAMGTYREQYSYDTVGNMTKMRHESSDTRQDLGNRSWTRDFAYERNRRIEGSKVSNILSSVSIGEIKEDFKYDVHGNTVRFPHLGGALGTGNVIWDFMDQMKELDLGGGGKAFYTYDAAGKRVRKVIERGTNLIEERLYLRGVEIFRKTNGSGDVLLERETTHILDDRKRIAMVEIRNKDTQGNDRSPRQLIRFQLESHLGSGSVELDDQAKILTFEEYSPFGTTTYQGADADLETPKRYRFTGKERDEESGFNYHGARYYAPWLGRWCSPDPSGTSDGVNLYLYCHANPIVGLDTTGRWDDEFTAQLQEVGDAYANKTPPTPLTPDPNPMSKDKYRQVANTENKKFRRNPPPETPLDATAHPDHPELQRKSSTNQPARMTGNQVQVSHLGGAKEAHEAGIKRTDFENLPKERVSTVSGTAAVMDPHTGEVTLVSNHRGVQEGAINQPALERATANTGGKLTPEGLKSSAEYTQWVGENTPLSEGNADLLRSGMPEYVDPKMPKPQVRAPVDKTLTKEMIAEAEHSGTDLFKKAARNTAKAKATKLLGKAVGHAAAALPFLGEFAGHYSAISSASEGDYVGAVLDEVGMISGPGDVLDLARAVNDLNEAVDAFVGTAEIAKEHGDRAKSLVSEMGGGQFLQDMAGMATKSLSKSTGVAGAIGKYNFVTNLFK